MNADDFLRELARIAPTIPQLLNIGLSAEGAEKFRAGYFGHRISGSDELDPLLDLCRNCDISSIEIGAVTLGLPTQFDQEQLNIGKFEADTIIYSSSKRVVSVRDHENLRREVCRCARTPEGFLSAMLVVAKFVTRCLFEPSLEEDIEAGSNALAECLSLAGGNECKSFYFVLLGLS